ncbi:hypothetical protein ACTQ43_13945 [Segatella copri]|jgi:hypothetical protein|uniref:hypothetical protein n=2 Tax=cellular organisms TaxID=131567 RepID=UPI003F888677
MAGASIDVTEVREAVADMSQVPVRVLAKVRLIVAKGSLNIKNQLRAEAEKSRHFKLSTHINYELDSDEYGSQIGPVKVGAGNLANIAYFGGSRGGGGTLPDPRVALEAETAEFMRQLADAAVESVFS